MNDRCCVCSTLASKEELMTTPCCIQAVGSLCFEEELQEDGRCCLCKAHPSKSDVRSLDALSDGAFACKVHFIPTIRQDDSDNKAEVQTARTGCLKETKGFFTGSAVADDQPRLSDVSKPLIADTIKDKETQAPRRTADMEKRSTACDGRKYSKCETVVSSENLKSFSTDFKPFVPAAKLPVPFLSQNLSMQQRYEPTRNAQCKTLDPLIQSSTTLGAALPKSQASENLDERKP